MTAARTRRATMADASALAALDAACFDVGWDADSIGGLLAGELTQGWRLDVGDVLVAALLVRVVAGEGEVLRLAVAPAWRRRGHARAIMTVAMARLGPHLPYGLHLDVRASNIAARTLYRALGFVETGRRTQYYAAPPEDAVLMRWQPAAAEP